MNKNPRQAITRRQVIKLTGGSIAATVVGNSGASTLSNSHADKVMTTSDITDLTALQLSAAIQDRKLSCVEVMTAYLDRIERINPIYNAIVSLRDRQSLLEEATNRDKDLAKNNYRGWMHGFPHAVKDLADAKGILNTRGSQIFKNTVATGDSIHVARIKKAGAIIIGKTNVPEFGLGSHTYNPIFGPTLNPYDAHSTAGGSSGGAAAALALRLQPVADGSDFMGSLRNPAAYNNVIGFRPTPGLVPLSRSFVEELPCNGPMARTVQDTAKLLSTIAGYHADSPSSLDKDPAIFSESLKRNFQGTKIGWLGDFDSYLPMEEGVLSLCEAALSGFEDFGCTVDSTSVSFSMEELWQTWLTMRHWLTRGRSLPLYQNPTHKKLLKTEMIWEIEGGLGITGDDVLKASAARGRWYAALSEVFKQYDFLVLPTAQVFPFDANTHWPREIAGNSMDTYHRWMEVVIPGTLSGLPCN